MPSRLTKADRSHIAAARFSAVVAALTRVQKRFETRLIELRDRTKLARARNAASRL